MNSMTLKTNNDIEKLIIKEPMGGNSVLDLVLILLAWWAFTFLIISTWPFGNPEDVVELESNLSTLALYVIGNAAISIFVIGWALLSSLKSKDRLKRFPRSYKKQSSHEKASHQQTGHGPYHEKLLWISHDANGHICDVKALR